MPNYGYSKEELLQSIRQCSDELSKTPTAEEYSEWAGHSHNVVTIKFGSWNAAIKAAGLEVNRKTPVTP